MKAQALVFAASLALCSCSQPLNKTAKGALAGGALGAGTGAIVGSQTGMAGPGIAIGAGIGALSGAIVGNEFDYQDSQHAKVAARQHALEKKVKKQQKEIDRLKAAQSDSSGS